MIWSYLSQFLQYGAALLVLPILLRNLPEKELGVWYVYLTLSILASLLELGFGQSFARSFAYVLNGATSLSKDGYSTNENEGNNQELLNSLCSACKKTYATIALIGFVALSTLGTYYVLYVTDTEVDKFSVLISWLLFVVAMIFGLTSRSYVPVMQGSGNFVDYYKTNATYNIVFILFIYCLVGLGWGLIGVSTAFLVAAVVRYMHGAFSIGKYKFIGEIKNCKLNKELEAEVVKKIWPNTMKQGVAVLGSFLILRANTLLVSFYLGLLTTASYAFTLQVFSVLQSISMTPVGLNQHRIASSIVKNKINILTNIVNECLTVSISVFLVGAIIILWFAQDFLYLIGSKTQMLSFNLLLIISIMTFLEMLHTIAATIIVQTNKIPFAVPSVVSGFAIFTITYFGLEHLAMELYWVVFVQLFVQLLYNNWKWPWTVYTSFYMKGEHS